MTIHSTEIKLLRQTGLAACLLLLAATRLHAQAAAPDGGGVRPGTLPSDWSTGGPKCMELPEWQVHEYNQDLYILRQSGCTDFEKPFVFLFFGGERALLLDSGSRNGHIGAQIQLTVHRWLRRNKRDGIPLTVVHTHGHGDHIAGDAELAALDDASVPVTLIAATAEANQKFYGMARWPDEIGKVDLGGRILDAIAIPGHQAAGVALYDRQTGLLFTGDSVYPGRLYIQDLTAYAESNRRLLRFTEGKVVTHILGNHIEQRRMPYSDYPVGTMYQPEEHELALSRGVLLEIDAALQGLHGQPRRVVMRDFSLVPTMPPYRDTAESEAAFKKTQQYEIEHMWDRKAP